MTTEWEKMERRATEITAAKTKEDREMQEKMSRIFEENNRKLAEEALKRGMSVEDYIKWLKENETSNTERAKTAWQIAVASARWLGDYHAKISQGVILKKKQ